MNSGLSKTKRSSRQQELIHVESANSLTVTPMGPPVYCSVTVPRVLQRKVNGKLQIVGNRYSPNSASGVVQANVVGGNSALQARLNLWTAKQQTIQRKSGPGVDAFKVPLRPKSGGLPLPSDVRSKMETAFGADFSDVRVHIGHEASSLGAIAYTWGTNIHFAPGQYNPHTIQGQKLLGHELWHVVQQRTGRVKNPFGGSVAVVQDHALEAEADRMGIKAAMSAVSHKCCDDKSSKD